VFQGPSQLVGVGAAFLLGPAPHAGRRAELAITAPAGDRPLDPVDVLARAVDAALREQPDAVALGLIHPGATLELRFA
jgi:hypothetical protein